MGRTLQNLASAFLGESQARNRYTFYAAAARKEGLERASEVFLYLAEHERVHAGVLYKLLGETIKRMGQKSLLRVEAEVPVAFGTTQQNVESSLLGEGHEHEHMYPAFAAEAGAEGELEAQARFSALASAEHYHEQRLSALLSELRGEGVEIEMGKDKWVCRKCGYAHEGSGPPERCPLCGHPESYFEKA